MLRSLGRSLLMYPRRAVYGISSREEGGTFSTAQRHDWAMRLHDPQVADIIAEELKNDMANNRVILEANPGPGLLTQRLLDLGCKNLLALEPTNSPFIPIMREIVANNADRVKLKTESLLKMASLAYFDMIHDTQRVSQCLEGIPVRDWKEEPCATAVVPLPGSRERKFLLAVLHAFSRKSMIFAHGRIDLLLFVSEQQYKCFHLEKEPRNYRDYAAALYELYFDKKIVTSVSAKAFQEPYRRDSKHPSQFVVVRLTPKSDVFERFPQPRRVEALTFFIKQCFIRGATLMYLNQLIPNATRDVLLQLRWSAKEPIDLTPDMKISAIKPRDLMRIFEVLSEHSLFASCPLPSSLDIDTLPDPKKKIHF